MPVLQLDTPKIETSPQKAQRTRARPTDPERSNTPPGVMKIPDP